MVGEIFGGAALLGLVTALWGQIKTWAWRAVSLLVVSVDLQGDAAAALIAYCWENFSRSPLGLRTYFSFPVFVRPRKRMQTVVVEQLGTEPMIFRRGWRFLSVQHRASTAGRIDLAGPMRLTFLRGMFNADRLLQSSMEFFNGLRSDEESESNLRKSAHPRFFIEYCRGQGSLKQREMSQRLMAYSKSNEPISGESGKPADVPGTAPCDPVMGAYSWCYRYLRWRRDELGPELPQQRSFLSALALPPNVDDLVEEAKRWRNSESWYNDKQIPWRRGWLLYGKPGTGKTSLVRALAQDLNLPISSFDIASMSNQEFQEFWRRARSNLPCIVLIEDIDTVFHGRENVLGDNGGGLSFDCLLNCLSGIENADGIFVVVTTNDVGKLDPALGVPSADGETLSTRPGRLDRAIELKTLDSDCRHRLASRILADCRHRINELVEAGDGDTGAQFQERCARVALQEYWETGASHNGKKHSLVVR